MRWHNLRKSLGRSTLGSAVVLAALSACANEAPRVQDGEAVPEPIFTPRPVTNQPGARRFVELASPKAVPAVAEQPSARGRSIGALAPFGSRVFLGYGDYSGNTGPITSVSWSSQTQAFQIGGVLSAEELLDFQAHAGFLFAADLDPRGHEALGSVFRLDRPAGSWQKMTDIPQAVHTFGMTEFKGKLFAGTGSVLGETARVVSTADAGESWQDEHTTLSPAAGFSRYTHLAATPSLLFVSGRVHEDQERAFAYTLEQGVWQEVLEVPQTGFLIPVALAGEVIVAQFSNDKGKGGQHIQTYALSAGRLASRALLPAGERLVNWSSTSDPTVPNEAEQKAPDLLWIVSERDDGSQAVHFARTFAEWELVLDLPPLPAAARFSAVAYLDDHLYLGSSAGGLYRVEEVFELAVD